MATHFPAAGQERPACCAPCNDMVFGTIPTNCNLLPSEMANHCPQVQRENMVKKVIKK